MAEQKPNRQRDRQRGAAMVEFALMLPLFVIFMLFLLIVYDLTNKHITLQVEASADLRREINQIDGGDFRQVVGRSSGGIRIDGGMAKILRRPYIPVKLWLVGFGGSNQGSRRSQYRRLKFHRYNL